MNLINAAVIAQALIVNHAKSDHKAPPIEGGHPDDRYYDRTGRLTNSIRSGKITADDKKLIAEILAGDPSLVPYAASIELGTSRHPAYPFLSPALTAKANEILRLFAAALKRVVII